jgi:hypothetical protein
MNADIAHERSLASCLNGAALGCTTVHIFLEKIRAHLFRAEQLIDSQPLPAKDFFITLPRDVPAVLETLKAASKCLEEWLESKTCQRILEKYPTRPHTQGGRGMSTSRSWTIDERVDYWQRRGLIKEPEFTKPGQHIIYACAEGSRPHSAAPPARRIATAARGLLVGTQGKPRHDFVYLSAE